jgi:hypothetical protein
METKSWIRALRLVLAGRPFASFIKRAALSCQTPGMLVQHDNAALGVRRIRVGGAFALEAGNGFMRAAEMLTPEGSFSELAKVASYPDINGFLIEDLRAREYRTRAQRAGA